MRLSADLRPAHGTAAEYRGAAQTASATKFFGGHSDVVISGDRGYLFYFTHPGRRGLDARKDGYEQRRSSIQTVELHEQDGWLTCDRDEPTHIRLLPQ